MKKEHASSRASMGNAEEMRTYVRGQGQIFHNFAKKLENDKVLKGLQAQMKPEEAIKYLHKAATEAEVEEGGVLLNEFDPSGTLGNLDNLAEHYGLGYLNSGDFLQFPTGLKPKPKAEA